MQLGELRQCAVNEIAPASKQFSRLFDVVTITLQLDACLVYL